MSHEHQTGCRACGIQAYLKREDWAGATALRHAPVEDLDDCTDCGGTYLSGSTGCPNCQGKDLDPEIR